MPNLSTLISGSVSVGILAGVVSGIFYLVVAGIRWAGEVKLQSGEWFYRQVQGRFNKAAIAANSNGGGEDGSVMDSDTAQVREFIEKLVEGLLNGRLDNVYVNRLYNHPDYDRMFSRYHSCLCETLARLGFALHMAITNKPLTEVESPSSVHAELKTLVNRIIRDAVTLPNFKQVIERKMSNEQRLSEDIDIKTYEDILATAILNKVIEKFQRYQVTNSSALDGNSNLLDGFPDHIGQKPKYISRLEIGVSENGSVEDCDGISRGDGSWSESSHTEPISLTVEECIEEVTTYNSSEEEEAVGPEDPSGGSELDFYLSGLNFIQRHRVPFPELGMDIIDGAGYESNESGEDDEAEGKVSPKPTDLYTPIESWEENWLFQKRRLKSNSGANQSVPVPMLVPNPSEDYRALIGDRDAEEISDLSECSEGELDATLSELASPEDSTTFTFPDRGVMSGGDTSDKTAKDDRNVKSDKSQQALSQSDTPEGGCGGSSEEYSSLQDGAPELAEATNNELFKASSVDCLSEFGQQDSEYTEDYAAVTQRQMSSLMLIDESEAKPISKPRNLGVPPQLKVNGESSTENQKADHLESIDSQIDIELATPPKPGTIAEREHKKWESALPLQNNPYSSENISKRLQKRSQYGSRSSSEASIELPDFHNEPPLVKHPTGPLKVVCTGSELDTKRYGRDYYVNSKLPKDETKQNTKLAALEELLLSSGSPQQPNSSNTGARQEGTVTPSSRSTTTEGNSKQSDSEELQQFSRHVESEVARWQHEINQTEQHWFKKLQSNKSENDNSVFITSTQSSDVTHEATCMIVAKPGKNKPQTRIELPHVADITRKFNSIVSDENKLLGTNKDTVKHQSSIKETNAVNIISKTFEKPPKVPIKETVRKSKLSKNCEKRQKSTKGEITSVSVISKNFEKSLQVLKEDNSRRNNTRQDIITKSRSCESVLTLPMLGKGMETKVPVTPYPRPPCVLMETLKANGDSPAMNGNSRKWEVESSRSEGSTVSSDSEFSPRLPSVKELSKHFSGGTDSDSSTSASKGPSPSPRLKGTDLCTAMKEVVIITKEDQLKEHQQQHYHLATPPTRPVRQVHSLTARSMTREFREGLRRNFPVAMDRNVYNTTGSDSSLTGAKSPVNGRDGYDTTPGYTSDESGTVSPVPTPGQMRNNIAFWEQMNSK